MKQIINGVDKTTVQATQYYAEMLTTVSGNTDVVYQIGNNIVPDFIVDNNGSFVVQLIAI